MVLTVFQSGQTVCLYGSYQEVTGGLGNSKRIPRGSYLSFAVSGTSILAWYYLTGRYTPISGVNVGTL